MDVDKARRYMDEWRADWNKFCLDVLHCRLDRQQQEILYSVQTNKMTTVASGTARGKDFLSAAACLCFLYLTPRFNSKGEMTANTKVAMTAPCFDEETEILTEDGWKRFSALTYNDKVAQRIDDNGRFDFVCPTDIIVQPYEGEMIGCKNKLVDFLTTPNHRHLFSHCIVSKETATKVAQFHNEKLRTNSHWTQYDTSKELGISQPNVFHALKASTYVDCFAGEVKYAKDIFGHNGRVSKKAYWSDGEKQDCNWFEFLGFWFAEGSATYDEKRRKYRISITQVKDHNIGYVDDLIQRNQCRFRNEFHKYSKLENGYTWELYEKEIALEFIKFGTQTVRAIPKYIKSADIDSMKSFLHGFCVGDGSIDKNGCIKLCTSSKQLANDLQEMCVKVGYIANLKEYKRNSNYVGSYYEKEGRIIKPTNSTYYEVKLCLKSGEYPHISKSHWYKQEYKGNVYCVTVPSHTIYVRRNGYGFWSMNSDRQILNIMMPEIKRHFRNANGVLPGVLTSHNIRTGYAEWFLTGFKASDDNTEAWSGFHAVNTMFSVTEASGISETIYNAIEGNLQGNSRLLLVFNPNTNAGYAAKSMKSERFAKFRLNSLEAENVVQKKIVIPGQVDYDWVKDKVINWCGKIEKSDFIEEEGDFFWEGQYYRPNDLFRIKVLGMFPRVSTDTLIPYEWVEAAIRRWHELQLEKYKCNKYVRLGVDVAGMGRDSSVFVPRQGNYVKEIVEHQSAGKADHMQVVGITQQYLKTRKDKAFVDTIGEGAGVYSRLEELGYTNAYSCKFSESARGKTDITGQYVFANMRAYLFWAIRDWLDPRNGFNPALPPNDHMVEELTAIHWAFLSSGAIIIESKDDIKKRIGRSPDVGDALANTFYPNDFVLDNDDAILRDAL